MNTKNRRAAPARQTQNRIRSSSNAIDRPASHANCFACGDAAALGLRFHPSQTGVSARVRLHEDWQGYAGIVHGGLIATLLDAAMTHCLFHHGIEGLTADLQVRYLDAIPCTGTIDLSATLSGQRKRIYELNAELSVAGEVKARASARFMRRT